MSLIEPLLRHVRESPVVSWLLTPLGETIEASQMARSLRGGIVWYLRAPDGDAVFDSLPALLAYLSSHLDQDNPTRQLIASASDRQLEGVISRLDTGRWLMTLHPHKDEEALLKFKRSMTANLAHEVRTPLTILRGNLETVYAGGLSEEEQHQFLSSCIRQTTRLESLFNAMLLLARIEGTGEQLKKERLTLKEVAESSIQDARHIVGAIGADVEIDIEQKTSVVVLASRELLEVALKNLLSNAIRASAPQGKITVRLAQTRGGTSIEVIDTGRGIAKEVLPRLFERFFTIDPSRSRETSGVGLGLSVVKHIVSAHGGHISVESEIDRGTTFTIVIPYDEE